MPRTATGKELKAHPLRVDDDVWQAIQKLKESYPTINAGLRARLRIDAEPIATDIIVHEPTTPQIVRTSVNGSRSMPAPQPWRGPLLKPKDRK